MITFWRSGIAIQHAQNVAGGLLAHPVHGFHRDARDMRRHDDVRQREQRLTGRRRLLRENVEARAGKLAGHQRGVQRGLVDNSAARRVDQVGGRLHPLQPVSIEHADRLRILRAMDADEVGARQRGVEVGNRFAARGLDVGGGLVGVENQDVHFHREAALGGAGADAPKADDQHRLAEEVVGQHAEPDPPICCPGRANAFPSRAWRASAS